MKLIDLYEMPAVDVPEVEHKIKKLFATVGITVKFSSHFEDRVTDGHPRGDMITKKDILDLFYKLKPKHDELIKIGRDRKDLEGVIRDALNELNVPFGLRFNKHTGRFILTLTSAMKKKNFHAKPEDAVIDV